MKKVILGCLAVVALQIAGGAVLFWYLFLRETALLEAQLTVPNEVRVGETTELTVETSNPHSGPVILDSIDIDDAFLRGFQVLSVAPEPTGTEQVPFIDQRSWSFGRSVPPGGKLAVRFTLKSLQVGHFVGNVDVCNPNQDYKSLYADVVVTER